MNTSALKALFHERPYLRNGFPIESGVCDQWDVIEGQKREFYRLTWTKARYGVYGDFMIVIGNDETRRMIAIPLEPFHERMTVERFLWHVSPSKGGLFANPIYVFDKPFSFVAVISHDVYLDRTVRTVHILT